MTSQSGAPIAFSDIDETLIVTKCMFNFLHFYLKRSGDDKTACRTVSGQPKTQADTGADRTGINRNYYAKYSTACWTDLLGSGRE
jgi:hypothetical protein